MIRMHGESDFYIRAKENEDIEVLLISSVYRMSACRLQMVLSLRASAPPTNSPNCPTLSVELMEHHILFSRKEKISLLASFLSFSFFSFFYIFFHIHLL